MHLGETKQNEIQVK